MVAIIGKIHNCDLPDPKYKDYNSNVVVQCEVCKKNYVVGRLSISAQDWYYWDEYEGAVE